MENLDLFSLIVALLSALISFLALYRARVANEKFQKLQRENNSFQERLVIIEERRESSEIQEKLKAKIAFSEEKKRFGQRSIMIKNIGLAAAKDLKVWLVNQDNSEDSKYPAQEAEAYKQSDNDHIPSELSKNSSFTLSYFPHMNPKDLSKNDSAIEIRLIVEYSDRTGRYTQDYLFVL